MDPSISIKLKRYPSTSDKSLQAWNAADELILDYLKTENLKNLPTVIYHDKFGFLSCHLADWNPQIICNYKSQEKAILQNIEMNKLQNHSNTFSHPLDQLDNQYKLALFKIPKSVDLFELYLNQLIPCLQNDAKVICGFMTRHFNKQSLEVAQKYFEEVQQTKASKKARLMILKNPRSFQRASLVHEIKWSGNKHLKQYFGVFSASKIDLATQLLLDHLDINTSQNQILDLGCGNGVLAWKARQLNPSAHIHLTDDNYLAIASAKLNIDSSPNTYFHYTDNLSHLENQTFDLVLSNPPFHFEFENNIDITIRLFKEVYRVLKPKGEFTLVANKHLNYKTHLIKQFHSVVDHVENEKFVIYRCTK